MSGKLQVTWETMDRDLMRREWDNFFCKPHPFFEEGEFEGILISEIAMILKGDLLFQ
jgi:hypothetical protein